jgi:uncharacterized membrane protein
MDPLHGAVALALLFAGSHVVLATDPLRSRLVARLGERGFRLVFSAVAAVSFTALVMFYADHRLDGAPGPALGDVPVLGSALRALVVAGVVLMIGAFARYTGSPYDVEGPNPARPARGLERVTRHPFFVGVILFATAHALLAQHRMASILMLALAALALVGLRHQDAKLARRYGAPFEGYLASTSVVPFAAVLAGRQTLVWRELPFGALALGLGIAVLLRAIHGALFAHRGIGVVAVVVGSAGLATLVGTLRVRHRAGAQARVATGSRS